MCAEKWLIANQFGKRQERWRLRYKGIAAGSQES